MNQHEKLNYVEFASENLDATKTFFTVVFGWEFVDYGPEYTAFSNQGLDGGFYKANACNRTDTGGACWSSIALIFNPPSTRFLPMVAQ
ncbi:glyoxalase family protein [Vibrio ishigakensis]|uniref:Glyoxalase family protein n=1 Tax=Vibrio ishigakensis TaxID=1481914 RepID=A0A0B8QSJ7_9VIBR|nr:glyoxalase family protein [Vibrio ishigakensis]